VIFPYVDLKHLHSLEVFTVGYNVVPLESTAIQNLREIVESEESDSYSQIPNLFLIFNLDKAKVKKMLSVNNIRCILNASENVTELASETDFIFYNKKIKKFLNYDAENTDLEFEKHLIASSKSEVILQDKIQKIKAKATRIFTEINQEGDLENIKKILKGYDWKYWLKILRFVELYYDINVPPFKIEQRSSGSETLFDYSNEYEIIISTNKLIAQEFIQLLHDYRSKKVNPSNLELQQLYYPQKLYTYLRNHHWKNGISEDFLREWIQMKITNHSLTRNEWVDFEEIFQKLKIPIEFLPSSLNSEKYSIDPTPYKHIEASNPKINVVDAKKSDSVPSVLNFPQFKLWMINILDEIENLTGIDSLGESNIKELGLKKV
jgi:hypothetical protein